jgi:hypothetical protein
MISNDCGIIVAEIVNGIKYPAFPLLGGLMLFVNNAMQLWKLESRNRINRPQCLECVQQVQTGGNAGVSVPPLFAVPSYVFFVGTRAFSGRLGGC